MNQTRIFLDTAYVLALLNPRDTHHNRAKELLFRLRLPHSLIRELSKTK